MRAIAAALMLLTLSTGCSGGSDEPPSDRPLSSARTTGAGARLVLLDSVRLAETDSSLIGDASGLAVGESCEIFIADAFSARVLEFNPEGQFVRAYGRKGKGPGELQLPIALILMDDTLLVVSNRGTSSPVIFNRRNGDWLSTGRVSGYIKSGEQVGDSLWLGVLSEKRSTSLATWRVGADSMHYFGLVPAEYVASAGLWSTMSQALISAHRQSACVDAVMPLSPDAKPMTALVGDRLVSFEQAAGGDNADSWVKTYAIDDSTCDWVPAR